jgi:hypothetical protein
LTCTRAGIAFAGTSVAPRAGGSVLGGVVTLVLQHADEFAALNPLSLGNWTNHQYGNGAMDGLLHHDLNTVNRILPLIGQKEFFVCMKERQAIA